MLATEAISVREAAIALVAASNKAVRACIAQVYSVHVSHKAEVSPVQIVSSLYRSLRAIASPRYLHGSGQEMAPCCIAKVY